jgi:hypothetical protein
VAVAHITRRIEYAQTVSGETCTVNARSILIGIVQLLCAAGVIVAAAFDVRWAVGVGIAALMGAYMWWRSAEQGYRRSKAFRVHLAVAALGLVFALVVGLGLV